MSVEEKSISKKKRIYFENLDGLRFLCFLSVFFFHSFHTEYEAISGSAIYHFFKVDIFGNGNIGVNFFFVLSGFLITFLLIEEKKLNGQINLKKFWIRRMLRIWPLFYFCVLFGFYIFPILKTMFGQVPNETANIGYYLLFLNNFDFINNGIPDSSMLGLLWSVAIEEQFYLVWPIILFLLPIKRYWMAFVAIIGVSLVFRA
ncbi:MAG: peptidoglycan/LPS O-acetylase OafA/YrhL, partial [Chitinophagales bacterium]